MARAAARMKDVAERAGVSMATVSRTLSAPHLVGPAARARVEKAVKDLRFTPDHNARSLRIRSSGVVIVLLPDIGNPFFSVLLQGIEQAARAAGRAILVGDTAKDFDLAVTYGQQLDARRADGMILLNGVLPFRDSRDRPATRTSYPVVVVSELIPGAKLPTVGIDNVRAAHEAVAFLAQGGHKRIAHIAGPPGNILTKQRFKGYQDALAAFGLDHGNELVTSGDFSIDSGRAAARQLLQRPHIPSAIFASNDEMAIGAIIELKSTGLRVPDDVSVVGFDDIEFAASYDPALTTIHQPRREMGQMAMQLMVDLLEGRRASNDIVLEHKLIVRASSAPRR